MLQIKGTEHDTEYLFVKAFTKQTKVNKFFNSERHLIEPQNEGSDLVPAPNSIPSVGKDTKKIETPNKK